MIFELKFATLKYLIFLIPLFFAFLFFLILKFNKKNRIIKKLTYSPQGTDFVLNFSRSKNILKLIFFVSGLIFLFIAALSPQWNKKEEIIQQEGRDILIALDISKSMLTQDLSPNRLEWSKNKIKELLKNIKTDRVGLILFSGSAFLQCPLTRDFSAFYMFLDQVDVESISSGTTSIEMALKIALNNFKNNENQKNKILILFTDGEDFSSNLMQLKNEAQKENLHIFSIGVGTPEGGPIPQYDQDGKKTGYQMDKNGNVVISKLNEGILNALSQESGAIYIKTTNNDEDIQKIYFKIKEFEKEKLQDKKINKYENQYPYFIILSFLFFALEWIL